MNTKIITASITNVTINNNTKLILCIVGENPLIFNLFEAEDDSKDGLKLLVTLGDLVPKVLGVPGIPGVLGVPRVLGVPGIPGVLGVPGVLGTPGVKLDILSLTTNCNGNNL